MTNKIIKNIFITVMVTTILSSMTGCSGKEPVDSSKPGVAFVIAHTRNAKSIDLSAPIIHDTTIDLAKKEGYSFIIRLDGNPEIVLAQDLQIAEQFKNASTERLERDALKTSTDILEKLDEVNAVCPEIDYLEALRCAASSLRSLDESYSSRTIVICGTGLGTTGYMSFQNNLLMAEPEAIVEALKEKAALPDLTGITVYWVGLGQVESPQEELTPKQASNLQNIWKAVITASGGEFEPNDYISAAQGETNKKMETGDLPDVTCVNVPPDKPIVFEPEVLSEDVGNAFQEPVMLEDSQISFVADKADYANPDIAMTTVKPIAEFLMEHESVRLLLIGCTAGDETNEYTLSLSSRRAETVKKTLVDFGVDEKRLSTIGMGSADPWHVGNAGYDGEVAKTNRKVVLIDTRTAQAQELMESE